MWESPIEAEIFEPSDSQGFISPKKVISPTPEILPFPPLTEEINLSLSAKSHLPLTLLPGQCKKWMDHGY